MASKLFVQRRQSYPIHALSPGRMPWQPLAAMIFHMQDGRIHTIYAIGNPDKLRAVAEQT